MNHRNHNDVIRLEFEGLALPQANAPNQEHVQTVPTAINQPQMLQCRALQVTVINAPIFAGRWNLALPEAHMSDRLLDIVVMEDIGIGHDDRWVADASATHEPAKDAASNGQAQPSTHHSAELSHIPGMHHVQARGVTITTHAGPQDATLDGEVRGQTPMYMHIAHEQLQVIVAR